MSDEVVFVMTAISIVSTIVAVASTLRAIDAGERAEREVKRAREARDEAKDQAGMSALHVVDTRCYREQAAKHARNTWDFKEEARHFADNAVDALGRTRLIEGRVLTIEERINGTWMQQSVNGLHADDV